MALKNIGRKGNNIKTVHLLKTNSYIFEVIFTPTFSLSKTTVHFFIVSFTPTIP